MGCAASKPISQNQYHIKLPSTIDQTSLQTEPDLLESSEQFLQIGLSLKSIGKLHPQVDAIYEKQKTLFPQLDERQYEYMMLPDESIFYGLIENGKRNGVGRQHWQKEGNFLEGTWVDDQLCGKARMIYPNGDYFEGLFCNNVANGQGKFVSARKEVTGLWTDNKLNGQGQEKRANGTVYIGQFSDGKIQGVGTFYWANGCKYHGQVLKGKMHGQGELEFPDKCKYIGEFRNNVISGKGSFKGLNGMYQSKFENPSIVLYFYDRGCLDNFANCTKVEINQYFE